MAENPVGEPTASSYYSKMMLNLDKSRKENLLSDVTLDDKIGKKSVPSTSMSDVRE